jgi:tetratricopeptide (TPR) repeat protein
MKNYISKIGVFVVLAVLAFGCGNHQKDDKKDIQVDQLALITEKIAKDPNNAALYHSRAKLYLEKKEINQALGDINKAIQLNDKKPEFYITLSDIFFAMVELSKSKDALLKAVSLDNQNIEAYLKLAELNLYLKQYDETFKYTDKAAEIDKLNPKAYFIKGFALKEKGDTSKAVSYFLKSIEMNPDYYEAFMQLGLLFSIKKNKIAKDYLNSALNIKPNSIEAHYALAMFNQETGNFVEAVKLYENIIALDKNYKEAYYNIGYINLVYLADYKKAVEYFSKAISVDKSYAEAYYNRGYAYELSNDFANARSDYKTAIDIKANYDKPIEGLNRLDKKIR